MPVLLGLLHVVLHAGLADTAYLDARKTGLDAVRAAVAPWWPERVERVAGVSAPDLRTAARLLADASDHRGGAGVYVLTGRGVEQHHDGTDTVTAAIDLALALGLPGRRGSGFGCLTGQGNGQGGREHGQKADQLPGYRRIDDPAARAHVAGVWGVDPDDLPGAGVPAVELLDRLGTAGGPRALLVHGSNVVVSAPDATTVTRRLRSLDLLVVCDVVRSETAELADVVLPVTQWAEEEGTMTTLEGRVVRRRRAVSPPDGVRDELVCSASWRGAWATRGCPPRRRRCSTSWRGPAPAARRTTPASTTTGSTTRPGRPSGRYPPPTPPASRRAPPAHTRGRRGCSSTGSPPRTDAPGCCR